ncbi:MAG: NUMOD3 domain-containing DNA-binding protein [Candidatus Woesearchaeota archaeon]
MEIGIDSSIECKICQKNMKTITNSHLKKHNITPKDYKKRFSVTKLQSEDSNKKFINSMTGRKLPEELKRRLSKIHRGKIIKEETRRKISNTLKGRKASKERIEKLKEFYKIHGCSNRGRKHTEKTRKKISESGKGRIPWNKNKKCFYKIKISKKLKGRKLSLETRKKMSIAFKGRIMSKEAKEKMSIAKKGVPLSFEHRKKIMESQRRCPNKFEKTCIKLFKENNLPLEYVGDYRNKKFFIGGKVPDFVSTNNKKVIIEVFHDYFKIRQYGSVENYKKERKKIFFEYGWNTLFFTYYEINSNPNKCISTIMEELK